MSWKLKEYERSAYTIFEIIGESGENIEKFAADEKDYAEKKKKAQLMAAAPELLKKGEALLKLLQVTVQGRCFRDSHEFYELRKAINKAKGADE